MSKSLELSPETVLMLCWAGLIDLIGIVLLCFALDDFGILDLISTITIGGWMFLRKGKLVNFKAQRKRLVRFLVGMGIEIVPYLGALPAVTIITYLTLTED
ncbi:MAG TPA: hypothetical protein PLV95_00580 [Candidatus Pacearchaeota archaeon]|nr:hypothetical protein [Candidatus Pacearchaeota archaeon]